MPDVARGITKIFKEESNCPVYFNSIFKEEKHISKRLKYIFLFKISFNGIFKEMDEPRGPRRMGKGVQIYNYLSENLGDNKIWNNPKFKNS